MDRPGPVFYSKHAFFALPDRPRRASTHRNYLERVVLHKRAQLTHFDVLQQILRMLGPFLAYFSLFWAYFHLFLRL